MLYYLHKLEPVFGPFRLFRYWSFRSMGAFVTALAVSLVREHRRGLTGSINNVSMRLPNAVGPSIAGLFLEAGRLTMPFMTAAILQALYAVSYGLAFRRTEDEIRRQEDT